MDATVEIKIVKWSGGEGLYINNYRVSGTKPYGGGQVVKSFTARVESIISAVGPYLDEYQNEIREWLIVREDGGEARP